MKPTPKPSFDTAMANLRNSINTRTLTGQHLADRLDELERAHEREFGKIMEVLDASSLELEALSSTLDTYMPCDCEGKTVCPGDFIEMHDELYHVDGVDTEGGVFFQAEDGWDYTLARLHRRATIDLDPADDKAPHDLWELACRIKRAWEDPDSDDNGTGMSVLVERLYAMADAARRTIRRADCDKQKNSKEDR